MHIEYRNRHGSVRLSGKGEGMCWYISEITGLGPAKKSFTYNTYAGIYGRELSAVTIPCRTITITGDIPAKTKRCLPMRDAMRILNEEGELFLQVGRKERRAKVRTVSFEAEEKKTAFCKFTWQVESDNPFFFGETLQAVPVFSREAGLQTSFVLPCMFSERHTEAVAVNRGDVETEPVLTLEKAKGTEAGTGGIVFENCTTGAMIRLEYNLEAGERVTVDIPGRSIQSDLRGSLMSFLSDDSVLRLFVLETGSNRLAVSCTDPTVTATCAFEELFLEASCDA